jgi:hypothetical protein
MHRQLGGTPVAERIAVVRSVVWIDCQPSHANFALPLRPACWQTSMFLMQYLRPSLGLARQAGAHPEVTLG